MIEGICEKKRRLNLQIVRVTQTWNILPIP